MGDQQAEEISRKSNKQRIIHVSTLGVIVATVVDNNKVEYQHYPGAYIECSDGVIAIYGDNTLEGYLFFNSAVLFKNPDEGGSTTTVVIAVSDFGVQTIVLDGTSKKHKEYEKANLRCEGDTAFIENEEGGVIAQYNGPDCLIVFKNLQPTIPGTKK